MAVPLPADCSVAFRWRNMSTSTSSSYSRPTRLRDRTRALSVSFAGPGASYDEIVRRAVITRFDKSREVTATLSVVVVLHPPPGKRLTPGLILGVTNHRVRDRTVYTPVSIPEGIDAQHPSVVGSIETHSRNIGGPTIGANLAIALTRQLSIVPDVRYDYGSIGDEINNSFRTSVRMQWRF